MTKTDRFMLYCMFKIFMGWFLGYIKPKMEQDRINWVAEQVYVWWRELEDTIEN